MRKKTSLKTDTDKIYKLFVDNNPDINKEDLIWEVGTSDVEKSSEDNKGITHIYGIPITYVKGCGVLLRTARVEEKPLPPVPTGPSACKEQQVFLKVQEKDILDITAKQPDVNSGKISISKGAVTPGVLIMGSKTPKTADVNGKIEIVDNVKE